MASDRPRIKIPLTRLDYTLEIAAGIVFLSFWGFIVLEYQKLNAIIPIHFDGTGQVDATGNKASILDLPIISSVIYLGLSLLSRFPHVYNYPVEITPENAPNQYRRAVRLMRTLKLSILIIFFSIAFQTVRVAQGETEGLGSFFLPITLSLIFIPLIVFIVRSSREKASRRSE